ncbi:MAG TPA: Ig-like domain-containing protein, partial [Longimicrobiales bacterium]|nr:Ig-like domain-containing protein [Longimicrobiales bacterium]
MRSRRRLLAALLVVAACGRSGSTAPDPAVSAITLSATSISFSSLLATFDVTATVLGGDGSPMSNASVTWTSQDPRVATVSSNGRVAAVGNGTTRVTASVSGVDASATVEVQQLPVSIALAPDPLVLAGPLDTASVRATVADAGGSAIVPVTVSWTTLDDGVATVGDSGLVTGVATGQTTITA